MEKMAKKSLGTTRKTRVPKHITKIAMTPEQYYELKVYIKSLILPGTPAFEYKRLSSHKNKQIYREWFKNALEDIGPRFFPSGTRGLAWPEDYAHIHHAVHQVERALSIGIRRNYEKREFRAVQRETGSEGMEMAQDDELNEGAAGDTDAEEGAMMLGEKQKYAQWEQEKVVVAMDQENQDDDTMEEEINAEPIELEDFLDLMMKPEVFANFPNLDDEYFDWAEVVDPKCPEPVRYMAHVDNWWLSLWSTNAKLPSCRLPAFSCFFPKSTPFRQR
ncbi:hypothetical protein HOY80DRAFT_971944 [Tuber brumale]|nr:hypothetical protein HOY80DRAFT_971944 [Tuber brumale]